MSAEEITKLIDDYAERIMGPRSEQARTALQSAIEAMQAELDAIHKEAETNQKWAFLEWRNKAEQLEVENLGLRLECQGLKAEIAEVKPCWKEAARKNAEMLAREANRPGGGL